MKKRTVLKLTAKIAEKEDAPKKEKTFYALIDKKAFEKIPEKEQKSTLEKDLKGVALHQPHRIDQFEISHSYIDPEAFREFDYGDILVEIHLPYCLHVPNGYEFEVRLPESDCTASVILEKHWTIRAKDSDQIDFFSEDEPTFFKDGNIITPKYPIEPQLGWEQYFTGKNIQKEKDANGVFRYTKLYIQFDSGTQEKISCTPQERKKSFLKILERTLQIVNRLLDVYRYISKEEYIERIGSLSTNHIYFPKINEGFYVSSMGFGIGSAMMNHSKEEIDEIENLLASGYVIPPSELLFLSSKASLYKKSFTLTVVEAFQALEIFLENYLITKLREKGLSDEEVFKELKQKWQTKERLKDLLLKAVNHSLSEDQVLWGRWCTVYDQVRNDIIHGARDATEKDATEALSVNEDVVDWIMSITPISFSPLKN